MNMKFKRKLPIPQEIKSMYPISESGRNKMAMAIYKAIVEYKKKQK